MARAMMKAGCGKTLLIVVYVLLYVNLIVDLLELWFSTTSKNDPIYSYLLGYSMASNIYVVVARMSIQVVEILVFFAATITIIKRKPSSPLLYICSVFVLLEMFYYIYALISLNCENITSFEQFSRIRAIEDKKKSPDSNHELHKEKSSDSLDEFIRNLTIQNKQELDSWKKFIPNAVTEDKEESSVSNNHEFYKQKSSDIIEKFFHRNFTIRNKEELSDRWKKFMLKAKAAIKDEDESSENNDEFSDDEEEPSDSFEEFDCNSTIQNEEELSDNWKKPIFNSVIEDDEEESPDSNDEYYDEEETETSNGLEEFLRILAINKEVLDNVNKVFRKTVIEVQHSEYSSTTTAKPEHEFQKIRIEYSNTLYGLDLVFALILILKAFSVIVIYICIVELKQREVHYNCNVERNVSAPPPTVNAAQFIQPQAHLHPYPEAVRPTHLHPNSQPHSQYPVQPCVSGVGSN